MKKLFLASAILFSVASVNAQDTKTTTTTGGGTSFQIAGNVGTGTKTGLKTTFGGDVQVDIPVGTGLKITGSAGYQNQRFDLGSGFTGHFSFIPILVGAKVPFGKMYAHGQLGYAINTSKGAGGHFSYAPSLGVLLSMVDLSLKYLSISDVNSVMLRAAIALGGSKK
jgi:hypothetical protein